MRFPDFIQLVSAALRRQTTLDQYIPGQARIALSFIEKNYTFKYMEKFRLLQLAIGDRVIYLPPGESIKAMKFFRLAKQDGSYIYLKKVEPEDLTQVIATFNPIIGGTVPATNSADFLTPTGYFQVGLSQLIINTVTTIAFNAEVMYYGYSDTAGWVTGNDPAHPILDVAPDLLINQTLLNMAVNIMKDLRMVPAYKELRDEAINSLTRAEDETKYGGEDFAMAYDPEYDLRLANWQPNR